MRTPSSQKCRLDLAPPLADRFILGFPIDCSPALLLMPFGFHLTMDTLPSGVRQAAAPGPSSPWAEKDAVEEIKLWAKSKAFPVKHSELTSDQTPTLKEFREKRHLSSTRIPEPEITEDCSATKEELDRFFEVLSGLTPSRVRFLYRQRWEACRSNTDSLPRVTDIQYLETTLRALDGLNFRGKEEK